MRRTVLTLIASALLAGHAHAEPSPAFAEARDFVLTGKAGSALLIVGVGAMGINDQDDQGFTLLHYAAQSGSLESVTELLQSGADPLIANKAGALAIGLAPTDAMRSALKDAAERSAAGKAR